MSVEKRLKEAVEKFAQGDYEAAFTPLCNAIDAISQTVYGANHSSKELYKRFLSERMELITRIAFSGTAILGMTIHISANNPRMPPQPNGGYTFEQILYHLVRCGLDHSCKISELVRDSGPGSGKVGIDNGVFFFPFDAVLWGLIVTAVSEHTPTDSMKGTVLEGARFCGVPLCDLFGDKARVKSLHDALLAS